MPLTDMKKHVGVLEHAGLVTTAKVGRVRTCRLGPRRLQDETAARVDQAGSSVEKRAGKNAAEDLCAPLQTACADDAEGSHAECVT